MKRFFSVHWRPDRSDVLPPSAQMQAARADIIRSVVGGTEAEIIEGAEQGQMEADLADAHAKYAGAVVLDLRHLRFRLVERSAP